jgi:O-antigen ligase
MSKFSFFKTASPAAKASPISVTEFLWLAIIFLLPLFFLPSVNTTFELPKVVLFRGLTTALVISWLAKICKEKNFKTVIINSKKTRALIILSLLTVFSWIVATIFSSAPIVSVFGYYPRFQGLYTWLFYAIFAAIVFLSLDSPRPSEPNTRQIERIIFTISLSAFFTSIAAILQKLHFPWLNFWDSESFLGRAFGTMGHPDFLATFLIMAIPLTSYLFIKRKYAVFSAVTLVLSIYTTVLTYSRSALLGLLISALFILVIHSIKKNNRRLLYSALAVPAVILIFFAAVNVFSQNSFVNGNPVLKRLVLSGENLRSIETRLQLWPAAIQQILSRPLTGYGLDTFAITFPSFYPKELNLLENLGDYPDRAHSFALDYASDLGIPALIIFICFAGFLLFESVRLVLKDKDDRLLPLMVTGSLVSIIIGNKFGFFVTCTWVYFWLLLAILLTWQIPKKSAAVSRSFNTGLKFFVIILSFFGLTNFYINDFSLIKADAIYARGNLFEAVSAAPTLSFYAESAAQNVADEAIEPIQNGDYNTSNFDRYLRANSTIESAGAVTNKDGNYYRIKAQILNLLGDPSYKEMFLKAVEKMPNSPSVYLYYGRALEINSAYNEAIPVLETYLSLCPDYYLWKKDLLSRPKEDQEKYRIFYKLNPDFDDVFRLLRAAYINTGDLKKASEYADYAIR